MSDVEFNEPTYRPLHTEEKRSGLAGLVISLGLATDDAGAQSVLLIVLVVAVLATMAIVSIFPIF